MFSFLRKTLTGMSFFLVLAVTANAGLDKTKYITIDEITPDMDAYALSVYQGTEIEKFPLEIVSVLRNFRPGRNAILVKGTDPRFIHTGPVAGCSGSPVYIDGRLAGALAFGWKFSKDPLYGVTPIEEMLEVGAVEAPERGPVQLNLGLDLSNGLDLMQIAENLTSGSSKDNSFASLALPSPLAMNGLTQGNSSMLNDLLAPHGMFAVPAPAGDPQRAEKVELAPGSTMTVPLVSGDISMAVTGTVTEVVGDEVYGFGHSFMGIGPLELPMATGYVHTVVSTVNQSFKLGASLEVVGSLVADEAAAVKGRIGRKASTIPLKITVDRFNSPSGKSVYNCRIADNQILTPTLLAAATLGAVNMLGELPPENIVEYKAKFEIYDRDPIEFSNISTGRGASAMVMESLGATSLILNNPFQELNLKGVEFEITVKPGNLGSRFMSSRLSRDQVRPGETVTIETTLQNHLARRSNYSIEIEIPENLKPGQYQIILSGADGYSKFLRQAASHKFMPIDADSMLRSINVQLGIERDRLYCVLVLPPDGLTLERAELPGLPATKAMILQDNKRNLTSRPHQRWIEESMRIDSIVEGQQQLNITVIK